MKKRQLYMIELEPEPQSIEPEKNQDFIENFQTAILLSLLENKQFTKWQFDFCLGELQKQQHKKIYNKKAGYPGFFAALLCDNL